MKNSLDKNAKWLLLFGILLTFLFPLLLPLLNKTGIGNFGVVGDAIGGITNPISQLIGSILLYLALKAQLSANGIVQNQIEKDNIKEEQQHNTEQIRTFYSFFQETIKNFSYEFSDANGKQLLYGKRAIKCFLNDLEQMKVDIHNTDDVLMYDGVRELLSILKSAEELFNRIDTISSKSQHILFYRNLLQHELLFNIFPYQDLDDDINIKTRKCTICADAHSYYPPIIFDKIKLLESKFI
jgi:hypothetical protein